VTDTATRLTGLSDEDLTGLHERLDTAGLSDAAAVEAHHLTTIEMLTRGISHGHTDDEWSRVVIVKETATVASPDEIDAPEGFEKAWGDSLRDGGTISVLLTVDGYVLKADPTVSDVHVDTIMGGGRRRKPKAPIFEMAKTIREENGKFTVYSEAGDRKFGTYTTRGEAEERLRQIERFSKAEGYSVPREVQAAAKRAMRWISDGKAGDGFTSVGRNRASQLAEGGVVSRATLVKMRAYFARHGKQRGDHARLDDGEPTPWRVAWDAWGGDAGQAWVKRVLGSVEKRAIPEAITDLHVNLENRQHAIDEYLYGPMNPQEPGDYWERLGDVWDVSAEEAATTRCGNCAAFNVKKEITDAIADAISDEGDEVVDAADLGYCELLQFKCAASRSCSVWLTGGPIESRPAIEEDEIELLETMDSDDLAKFASYAYLADEMGEVAKRGNPEALRDYWREGGDGQVNWGAGGDFTSCVAAVSNYMTDEEAKGYCAIRHFEVNGFWPGDSRNRPASKAREAVAKFTLPGGAVYEITMPAEDLHKHLQGKHDQKDHGRRASSTTLDPEVATSIIERVRAQGGLSVSMIDGSEPPDGYMVARTKGVKASIAEASDFYDPQRGPEVLGSFLKDNKAQLTGGDYLGLWHDTNSGKVFLDVSQNVKDRATAERLGRERDQISIWDVVEGQEIQTGGTGEIAKADSGDQIAGSVADDRRGDRRLRGGDLGETEQLVVKHGEPGRDTNYHAKHPEGRSAAGAAEGKTYSTRDHKRAISMLARGEKVILESTEDANTFIEKLHEFSSEAREKGEDAGNLDLCRVSVPGTNLFCGDSLGVQRIDMPQLAGQPVKGSPADKMPKNKDGEVNVGDLFRERLEASGVDVRDMDVPAAKLKASQNELKGANVAFMMSPEGQKIVNLEDTRIFVSADGYVIDGHHRWAANIGLDANDGSLGDKQMKVTVIDMPISEVLQVANNFADEIGIAPKAAKAMSKHLAGKHDQKEHGRWAKGTPDFTDKAPTGERSAEAVSAATALRDRVLEVEPTVTGDMTRIATSLGGEMESLKHRVKTTDSLARKIDANAEAEFGGDRQAAASKISDALRYTMVVDDSRYTDGVADTIRALESEGYQVDRVKNFWQTGDPYDGVNMKLSKDGVAIEFQMHTPTSSNVKSTSLHADYDRYRTSKNDSERKQYWDRMVNTAQGIPRPAKYSALLGIGSLVLQTFETAQQAGLV